MNYKNLDIQFRLETLEACDSSSDILEAIIDLAQEHYYNCRVDSYDVVHFENAYDIIQNVMLICDLREYTQLAKVDENIPKHLMYIHNHVNNKNNC